MGHGPVRRVVRVFPEYGSEGPLWEDGTPEYQMTPENYGLSVELTDRLRVWNDHWATHFRPFSGWDDVANSAWWHHEGRQVVAILAREVRAVADVRCEAWC